jgi:hypothetical protein
MWSCNIWQEAAEERGMVSLNAACPRMRTEGVREMARRTRIKPAYPCMREDAWRQNTGLFFIWHWSPSPSWGTNAEARKMSSFVLVDRSRLVDPTR